MTYRDISLAFFIALYRAHRDVQNPGVEQDHELREHQGECERARHLCDSVTIFVDLVAASTGL